MNTLSNRGPVSQQHPPDPPVNPKTGGMDKKGAPPKPAPERRG